MNSITKIDNKLFIHKEYPVCYSDENMSVQIESPYITIEKSNNEKISYKDINIKEIQDFKSCKYGDKILITFGGEDALLIENSGEYKYFNLGYRQIVTDLHIKENLLVFGCLLGKLFHFVVYDIENKKRVCQTKSIEAITLSYEFSEHYIYVLMGNSQVLCYDYSGREIWKRFEHNYIVPGFAVHKKQLIYGTKNSIKFVNQGGKSTSQELPLNTLDKIQCTIGNNLYGVCNSRKNIFCLDLSKNQILYEVISEETIRKILVTKGFVSKRNSIVNVLFYSTDNHLNVIDIDNGEFVFQVGIQKIKEIRNNEEIIIDTYYGDTHILKKAKEDESSVFEA